MVHFPVVHVRVGIHALYTCTHHDMCSGYRHQSAVWNAAVGLLSTVLRHYLTAFVIVVQSNFIPLYFVGLSCTCFTETNTRHTYLTTKSRNNAKAGRRVDRLLSPTHAAVPADQYLPYHYLGKLENRRPPLRRTYF